MLALHVTYLIQKIALVHDMAEALVGDITPSSGISKEEKHKLELVVTLNHVTLDRVQWSKFVQRWEAV